MTISFAHMGFNIINTFIFFWFIKQLVWLVTKIIKGDDGMIEIDVDHLQDDLILSAPILALESAKLVVVNMGKIAEQMLDSTIKYSFENNNKEPLTAEQIEQGLKHECPSCGFKF